MSVTAEQVASTITGLTVKGRETMLAVGEHKLSFFDQGIVEGSGTWGENLTGELGHKSSGVINRLAKLNLWEVTTDQGADSAWWSLTALGAAVANALANPTPVPATTPQAAPTLAKYRDSRAAAATFSLDAPVFPVVLDGITGPVTMTLTESGVAKVAAKTGATPARVREAAKRQGFVTEAPPVGAQTWQRPQDAAANFRHLASVTTGKAATFWAAKAASVTPRAAVAL